MVIIKIFYKSDVSCVLSLARKIGVRGGSQEISLIWIKSPFLQLGLLGGFSPGVLIASHFLFVESRDLKFRLFEAVRINIR